MNIDKIAEAIRKDAGEDLPELEQSLAEMKAGKIGRKYSPAQRMIRHVRLSTKMSQPQFAKLLDTPVGTLRDWEQGRFEPTGPAIKLAGMIQRHPELIKEIDEIRV